MLHLRSWRVLMWHMLTWQMLNWRQSCTAGELGGCLECGGC
jgi:hypothetical protein